MSERLRVWGRRILTEKIWKAQEGKHDFEVNETTINNLSAINELLLNNSVVLYSNHTRYDDAQIATSFAVQHLPNGKRFIAPIAMKHYDLSRKPITAVMYRLIKPFGLIGMPVVQKKDKVRYSEVYRDKLIGNLKELSAKWLNMSRTVYGIEAEGTRNEDGVLTLADNGLGKLVKYNQKLYYAPLAIVYPDINEGVGYVAVGEPVTAAEVMQSFDIQLSYDENQMAQIRANEFMFRLAGLLPESKRGQYSEYNPYIGL